MASRMSNAASDSDARMTIEIPNSQPMVALLGSNDEYLRLIENAFPSVSVLVRGNEIRLDGSAEESAVIDSLIAEMLAMLRTDRPCRRSPSSVPSACCAAARAHPTSSPLIS